MNKWLIPALVSSALLSGCASPQRGSIPVVDSGTSITEEQVDGGGYRQAASQPQAQSLPQDAGVVVMVPGASNGGSSSQALPAASAPISGSIDGGPVTPGPIAPGPGATAPGANVSNSPPSYGAPAPTAPSGIPAAGGLAADEQLDGPVLALLTTAQQQQGGGDLNGAASSLERAQRIAPREPQVLYRLAEVRLAQGDAAQAEQLAQRGLSYAGGRPALQASLWGLIAQARERQGNAAGAAQARERARANL
ncbi:tetratricopeptide repeat protein [Pseudomonas cavernae]|uniref:Tetratricopeptide repeat protein n=1 Tax=Pseudomonas cavernae TaxID=2320867 RepID=A0A385Z2A0_9PSED|nr:tetratricopeptide repeat protein [Pseudomonas cavernae]AYC31692.1 tetratricopeptide repeat protein [Pseudomonas cavernae]